MTPLNIPRAGEDLSQIRVWLADIGFDEATLVALLGLPADSLLLPPGHVASLTRLAFAPPDPLVSIAKLLLLGRRIPLSEATAIIPGHTFDMLLTSGLLSRRRREIHPHVRLTPFDDLVVAGDLSNEEAPGALADAVEHPHQPARVLSRLIPRGSVARSLDVGTGCGLHALQLASTSKAVVATDVSQRALAFGRLNAALNGVTNVSFECSDVIDHLQDAEPFDLIVGNPPYLLSPDNALLYRDGPAGSAQVASRMLSEASARLAPGGLLVTLSSWSVTNTRSPADAVAELARTAGCSALVIIYAERPVLDDALRWNRHRHDARDLHATLDRWLTYYQEHGIDRLAYGAIALTPAVTGEPWIHVEYATLQDQCADDGQLRDLVAAHEHLSRGTKPGRLTLHPATKVTSSQSAGPTGELQLSDQVLRSTRGLALSATCGPHLLAVASGQIELSGPGAPALSGMLERLYQLGLAQPTRSAGHV